MKFAAIGVIFLLAPLAGAQPLTDRLPERTAIYIGWSPSPALAQSKPGRMLGDDSFMRPWRGLLSEWATWMNDDHSPDKFPDEIPQLLTDAIGCEGCFAVTELQPSKTSLRCQAALILNLGEKRKAFESHFKPLHERIKKHLGEKVQLLKMNDSWLWVMPDRAQKPELIWGILGDRFVMLWGDKSEALLASLQNAPPEKSLKTSPGFAEAQQRLASDGIMFTFVNGPVGLDLLKRLVAKYAERDLAELSIVWPMALGQVGLDNLSYVAEKTTLADGNFVSHALLKTNGAPSGLLAAMGSAPVDEAMLKAIPSEPMIAAAFRLDLAKTYEQSKAAAAGALGDPAAKRFDEFEKSAEAAGLPVKEILGPIGDQWVIYNASSTGGFFLTGWTIVGTIRDQERFGRTLLSIRRLLSNRANVRAADVEEMKFDGATIQYLRPSSGVDLISPAWAMVGDKFIVASYPQLVEDAIRQLKSAKSILDDPSYRAARQRAGDGAAISFISGTQLTRNAYPILLAVYTAIQGFSGTPDGLVLPSMQHLLEFVGDDFLTIKALPDGLLLTRSAENPLLSPLSIPSPVVCVLAALPEMIWFSPDHEHELSQKNLEAIGRAYNRWSADHKEIPPDLQTLVDAKLLDGSELDSPLGQAANGPDYIYLKPDPKLGKNTVMVYDAVERQQGKGVSVLYTNVKVEFCEQDVFEKVLRESKIPAKEEKN